MILKRYVLLLLLVCVGVFIYWIEGANQRLYNEAKQACKTEIWLVYDDIGPTLAGGSVRLPYPEKSSELVGSKKIYTYGCSENEARSNMNAL